MTPSGWVSAGLLSSLSLSLSLLFLPSFLFNFFPSVVWVTRSGPPLGMEQWQSLDTGDSFNRIFIHCDHSAKWTRSPCPGEQKGTVLKWNESRADKGTKDSTKDEKKISPTISWQISPTSHKFTALLRRGERRTIRISRDNLSPWSHFSSDEGNLSRDRQNDIFADTDSTLVF